MPLSTVSSEQSAPASLFNSLAKLLWVPVILVLASFGVAGTVTLLHTGALSPVDEWVYVDYLYKLPAEGILHQGEAIGQDALNIMACDGVKPYGPMGMPCGSTYSDLSKFPYAGITSADPYTPIYFWITKALGHAAHALTGLDQLASWRLTGSLWLAGGVVAFYALLRQWRVGRVTALGLGLAVIAAPFSWWTYTYVSTDAPSFLFGALLLLMASRYVAGKSAGWWIPALSVLAVLIKVTNILAVCLVALYLLAQWIFELRESKWQGWKASRLAEPKRYSLMLVGYGILSVILPLGAQGAWLTLRRILAAGASSNQAIGIPLSKQELVSQMVNFLPGTIVANVNISGSSGFAYPIPAYLIEPLSWICVAGVIGAFWSLRTRSPDAPMIVSVALAAALFAPMLAVVIQLSTGTYYPLPPRYGAPILAGFLLLAGISIRNRWATGLLLAYSVGLAVVVLALAPSLA